MGCFLFIFSLVAHFTRASESQNPFAEQKLVLNLQALTQSLVEHGVMTSQVQEKVLRRPGEFVLPSQTSLLALIDTRCASQGYGQEYTKQVGASQKSVLPLQAYKLKLKEAISINDLSVGIEQDPCVVGVTEDAILHTQGEFTNDPMILQQSQMSTIHADEAYDFFLGFKFKN